MYGYLHSRAEALLGSGEVSKEAVQEGAVQAATALLSTVYWMLYTHALTPNTVELIPTLGALSPRGGPVQDPVLTQSRAEALLGGGEVSKEAVQEGAVQAANLPPLQELCQPGMPPDRV